MHRIKNSSMTNIENRKLIRLSNILDKNDILAQNVLDITKNKINQNEWRNVDEQRYIENDYI